MSRKTADLRQMSKRILAGAFALAGFVAWAEFCAARARRKHPPVGRFITVDGVRLHYVEQGRGDVLVLLGGNGSVVQDFLLSDLSRLASRNFRVIIFDRPGYGWSERPGSLAWTPSTQADLLSATLRKLGVERVHLFGHSWGTLVALEWALRHREQVASLCLASGYYYPTMRPDVLAASVPALPALGGLLRRTVVPLFGRLAWGQILQQLFSPSPVPEVFRRFPRGLALAPRALRASAEESGMMLVEAARLQGRLAGLRMPISIISGEEDGVVAAREQSERLHLELRTSRFRMLPKAGHMIHHTHPQEVMAAIEEAASLSSR